LSTQSKPTKRELRDQRRAERVEAERAEAARATRRRRTFTLLGALGVAAVLVVVAIAVSSSGGKSDPPASAAATSGATSLFAGIPERDGVLGKRSAPLTVTEFVDLQCPICAETSKTTLPALIKDYVRTGKVKLDARTLHFIGPDSSTAALMAAGAQQQGKLWPFLETFYAMQGEENSGYVTDAFLREVAQASGVDAGKALAYARTPAAQEALDQANRDAETLGVNATPTFAVAHGDGRAKVLAGGNHDIASLASALDAEAKQ
jgi:protein-disulfide isomerase